ncbi:hypothetical protein [Aquibaculum arenosum]|uniref:Secreted protein n=1 Tax=Aquibaculum arenosum TaxID=3032591 RepID=A0ABT5YKM0_9PROT|nr:hypothetical protein [Fodinicurvata sp. CAU 1616]MDF2095473.1 hypothetical protein [Fodinicurvata sp. CAU 1616]
MLRILLCMAVVAGLVWLGVSLVQSPGETGRTASLYVGPLPDREQGEPRLAGWQSVPIPGPDEQSDATNSATNDEERP